MEFKSKVKNKRLRAQSREIINSVLKFMKEEASVEAPLIEFSKIQQRVATATGVSLRTIKSIAREGRELGKREGASFKTPGKKHNNKNRKIDLDDFGRSILRSMIFNFYITEKQIPTIPKIHQTFCMESGYTGCAETLRKELHAIGFKWVKIKTNKKLLVERHDIRQLRLNYLKNIKMYREQNRNIVYMDETYINTSQQQEKSSTSTPSEPIRNQFVKGPLLLVIHAGGENGLIPGVYLTSKSNSTTGDYHHDLNFSNYKKWVEEILIKNLPAKSVLVIDNAPYHNKQIQNFPTAISSKEDMQEWLKARNIQFSDSMLKPELYNLIKIYKPKYKTYEIDKILIDNGHNILRLPPHHPDLNPIELVWASLKQYVSERNVNSKLSDTKRLCNEFFQEFSINDWKTRCERVRDVENELMKKELLYDSVIDEILLNLGDNSDTDNCESSSASENELPRIEEVDFI